MRVEAVGTAGGKTVNNRLTTFLIDDILSLDAGSVCTGLDMAQQLRIRDVFVSHVHMDHVGELPLLVDNMSMHGQSLVVHATAVTIDFLRTNIFNNIVWPDFTAIPSTDHPALRFREVRYMEEVQIGDYSLTALPVHHLNGSAGCHVSRHGRGLVYTSDTGKTDAIWQYVSERNDIQSVITECSFPADMEDLAIISRHYSSRSLREELVKLKAGPRVYIYHLKPQFSDQILKEIDGLDVTVLQDGMFIEV